MELDFKLVHEISMKELASSNDKAIMFEALATQLEKENKELQNEITKKQTEFESKLIEKDNKIDTLRKELENLQDKELNEIHE